MRRPSVSSRPLDCCGDHWLDTADDVWHRIPTHLTPITSAALATFECHRAVRNRSAAPRWSAPPMVERTGTAPFSGHEPKWEIYRGGRSRTWRGINGVQEVQDLPDILLVPLTGHTRGHTGVAVRLDDADHGLLHAGGAYFHHRELDPAGPRAPLGLRVFESVIQIDRASRLARRNTLRRLKGEEVKIFCAHDKKELERFRSATRERQTP
jgi:glyoxylase-like metal-dependent hydrolase (beta-lactamase superfamily II)